ncbi:hypothetical protein J2X43_003706 [Rhizobium sp. BE258]|nr:hypothetical protein [Rhizobium sp. BE258]
MSNVLQSRNVRKALAGTPTSPDLSGWAGLKGRSGAGERHPFGFSFLSSNCSVTS